MVKIKTETFYFVRNDESIQYKAETKLSSRNGTFSMVLPEWMHGILGRKEVYSGTLDGVRIEFNRAIEAYKKAKTNKKKVISYEVDMDAFIMDKKGEKCLFRKSNSSSEEDTMINIKYSVCYRHEFEGKIAYCDKYGKSCWHSYVREMDWTPQREKFFKDTIDFLKCLILKSDEFFNSDSNKDIGKLIDSGSNLLENKQKK